MELRLRLRGRKGKERKLLCEVGKEACVVIGFAVGFSIESASAAEELNSFATSTKGVDV